MNDEDKTLCYDRCVAMLRKSGRQGGLPYELLQLLIKVDWPKG